MTSNNAGTPLASAQDKDLPELIKNYNKCASLSFATENDISFYTENEPHGHAKTTKAGLVFVPMDFKGEIGSDSHIGSESSALPPDRSPAAKSKILRVENPYHSIIECAKILNNHQKSPNIDPTTKIYPNVSIYQNVKIGKNCVIHSGAVIGSRGFGFYEFEGKRREVPHFGGVVIGDNCEIGANSVIAAGFLEPTTLGDNCKLDSLVQIGHNCKIGNDCIFCAQSGLAGSVIVENGVTLAGGAQVSGHLTLGEGCSIAAKAGVTKSVPSGKIYAGFPAIPIMKWNRSIALFLKKPL